MSTTDTPAPEVPMFVHEATADKLRAEARKAAAEAEKAEHEAHKALIERDKADHARKKELAANEFHHRYVFTGSVDNTSCQKLVDQLDFWDRTEEPGELELMFFSPGGSVFAGMALFDHIQSMRVKGWHVTTVCRGYAASMGGILVQSGDHRVIGPESYIHIHEVSAGAMGKASEIEDELKLMEKMNERIIDIYASRSKLTKQRIRNSMRRKEWWVDSTEALKFGLVDEIR